MKNQKISSICERFRTYFITNDIDRLLKEFHQYRTTWKTDEFCTFLLNALVLMRKWVDLQEEAITTGTNTFTTAKLDMMRASSHDLFFVIVDYLQSDVISTRIFFSPGDMWKEIILNRWTMNEKFYCHLANQQIKIPSRHIHYLYDDLHEFYVATMNWSSATKIKLIELGFTHFLHYDNLSFGFDRILPSSLCFTLTDYHALAERSQTGPYDHTIKLVTSMNTPEKMKIFFDFYPNVDVSELIPNNHGIFCSHIPLTMLDRLLRMEPSYYETIDLSTVPNLTSDHLRFRAANTLQMFKDLICQGAKFSIALHKDHSHDSHVSLFVTTLGFYILSLIRFRDHFIVPPCDMDQDLISIIIRPQHTPEIVSNVYMDALNNNYIQYLIKRASTFSPKFRSFFFTHLNSACPFMHTHEFLARICSTPNTHLRDLYEELIEQNRPLLTLKQRCRLLIKQSLNTFPSDLERLTQLPLTLRYYASFDLLNPNFVRITLDTLTRAGARIVPEFFDKTRFHEHEWEPIFPFTDSEDELSEEEDDDSDYFYHDDDDDFMYYDDDDEDELDEDEMYEEDDDLLDEDDVHSGNNDEDEWSSID